MASLEIVSDATTLILHGWSFFFPDLYIQFNGILDPKKPNLFEGGADTVMLRIYPVDLRVR